MRMVNELQGAHLGFTALYICWKFPLVKSPVVYFQGKMGEQCRKKVNEMLSENASMERLSSVLDERSLVDLLSHPKGH